MIFKNLNQIDKIYDIDMSNTIGEGGFGVVYKCTHKISGLERAMKRINLKNITNMQRFEAEIKILK